MDWLNFTVIAVILAVVVWVVWNIIQGAVMEKLMQEFSEKVAKAKNDLLKNILAKHGLCYDDVFQKKVELYAVDSRQQNVALVLYIVKDGKIIDCIDILEKIETINEIMNYKTWGERVESDMKYEDLLEIFNKPDPSQTSLFDMIGEQ